MLDKDELKELWKISKNRHKKNLYVGPPHASVYIDFISFTRIQHYKGPIRSFAMEENERLLSPCGGEPLRWPLVVLPPHTLVWGLDSQLAANEQNTENSWAVTHSETSPR